MQNFSTRSQQTLTHNLNSHHYPRNVAPLSSPLSPESTRCLIHLPQQTDTSNPKITKKRDINPHYRNLTTLCVSFVALPLPISIKLKNYVSDELSHYNVLLQTCRFRWFRRMCRKQLLLYFGTFRCWWNLKWSILLK